MMEVFGKSVRYIFGGHILTEMLKKRKDCLEDGKDRGSVEKKQTNFFLRAEWVCLFLW